MTRDRDRNVTQSAGLDGGAQRHKVIIIGAGFGGLGAGYRLKQAGERRAAR